MTEDSVIEVEVGMRLVIFAVLRLFLNGRIYSRGIERKGQSVLVKGCRNSGGKG